jgi:MerR family mercuric resistance operon transcriptional regulator
MRIGELARSVDVSVETIRYYQRIGLLGLPEKPYGGIRSYNDQDLQRLRFIRRAQQLGFSLEDIRELFELSSSDCERVEELATQKLSQVKAKLRQLRGIESALAETVEQCARRKGNQPCPIIETLTEMK